GLAVLTALGAGGGLSWGGDPPEPPASEFPLAAVAPPTFVAPAATGPSGVATAAERDRGPFAWLVVAALVVLWLARDVLGPFIVAAVLAYAFSPLIAAGERRTGLARSGGGAGGCGSGGSHIARPV